MAGHSPQVEAFFAKLRVEQPKRYRAYEGLQGLDQVENLDSNAAHIAERMTLNRNVLDFLYAKSRFAGSSRAVWERHVLLATVTSNLLRDLFSFTPLDQFDHLIDRQARDEAVARLTVPEGMLVLAFHGGFPRFTLKVFLGDFADAVMIQRGGGGTFSAQVDPAAALYSGISAPQNGQKMLVAPDGPYGRQKGTIHVLGAPCAVTDGAPFLAHQTGCRTVFFTLTRNGDKFTPVAVFGPRKEEGEPLKAFRERLYGFYAGEIEKSMTGDPRSLSLSGRWIKYFQEALTRGDIKIGH